MSDLASFAAAMNGHDDISVDDALSFWRDAAGDYARELADTMRGMGSTPAKVTEKS
jgi:hypothetical protein